jgi:putative pyruvate formate lyase activating enzyme
MATQSRREFLKKCLYLSLSGLGSPFVTSCNGYERKPKASPVPSPSKTGLEFESAYLKLQRTGELKKRGEELWQLMRSCKLCPRECGVNRLEGNKGFCQATSQLEIASFHPHFGEEKPLVGKGGSGTIFLTNCGLRCVFCINWEISQGGEGKPRSIEDMARMMLKLQEIGCHNINVVTPTHYSPHIVLAVDIAASKGLRLPVVYNTCGWERIEIMKILDGIVDIYLPDFKYSNSKMAAKYSSGADTYPEQTKLALLEMNRQVGMAQPGKDGIMHRGLMIRHLVMPTNTSGSKEVMTWIAKNLPKDTYVNIMSQYRPVYKASEYPEIARPITFKEYDDAVRAAKEAGLTNLDIQGYPV